MTLQKMIAVRWATLNRLCPEDNLGYRTRSEQFRRGLAALEKAIEKHAIATVKDREGELCFVVAIDDGLYLDDREWLSITYIKPSHGFTPHDHYSGYWLPAGVNIR